MNHKRITMTSIVLGTLMLVSLFAAVSSAASVSGTTMAGTGPAVAPSGATPPTGFNGWFDFFAVDTSGTLWHGANGNWDSLGGTCTASPAAVSWNSNYYRLDVFVRGSDGAVWQKYWDGSAWSRWTSLGGQVAPNTGPGVDEALHLFVQGTDNQLWFKSANGAGTAWRTLGGAPPEALSTSSPSAGLPPDDHSMVCVSSTSGTVWYSTISLTGVWDTWSNAGSPA